VSADTLGLASCLVHVRNQAVGDCWGQLAGASMALDRILVHQSEGRPIPLEPAEIYYLEAEDYQTVIRLRGKRLLSCRVGKNEQNRSATHHW
jgi:DNA-binding LytR/AlgR family response regulator